MGYAVKTYSVNHILNAKMIKWRQVRRIEDLQRLFVRAGNNFLSIFRINYAHECRRSPIVLDFLPRRKGPI